MMSLDREPFFSLRSLAAILLGFLFWIFAINALSIVGSEDPLWLDELHTLWSISGADSDIWFRSLEWNQTPAYFYLMHHWSSLFGTDPLVLRLVSIIAFLICAAVMFGKIRSSTGSWCAAISAGVGLALCEPSMFYASEARPYALLMLATLIQAIDLEALVHCSFPERSTRTQIVFFRSLRLFLLSSLMVGLHPTSFVTLFGELLLLGVLAASSSVWARESKNVYLAGTTVAGAILVNGIWIWLLRDTFSRKQAWPQISDWQNLFFWAVWVGAVLGIALQLSRFFPSPFEKSRVWRERADFFGWLSMINVGLFLFSDRVGIFPVANIRYTISILPVVFLAWGLKVGTSASRWGAWAISGGALAGLIWVPQPHWQSQGIKWDDSPNWMAQAVFRGTVAQMRNENWQAACETINQESAGHMVTVFLFSNLLEDRFWTNELTTDDPAILNSRTFPVQPFLGTKTNIQILPKPTLVGPRFSKEELEKQLRQDSKKRLFLLIRGEPTTVNDILRELLMIASSSRIHLSIREREVDLVPGHLRLFELTVDPAIRDGTRIMEPKDGFQATSLVGL